MEQTAIPTPERHPAPMGPPGSGPYDRNPPEPPDNELLRLALNQIDYGLVVLDADSGMLQFANGPGHAALHDGQDSAGRPRSSSTGLCLVQGRVATVRPGHHEQLRATLARTGTGLRGLLSFGADAQTSAVAVLPLPTTATPDDRIINGVPRTPPRYALLVFAKQQLCDDSTVALFARGRGLTGAEAQVLAQVCKGLRPAQIATRHGVRISTVRTQLRSIRMKTHCQTIRELVQKVSVLPPMARHLAGPAAG